jgi:hypothetical protein
MLKQPKEVLEEIVAMWPVDELGKWPKDETAKGNLRQRFQDHITDGFNISSFSIPLNPQSAEVTQPLVTDMFAKAIIYDPDPFLAVLKQGDDEQWRLDLIEFQCATCFGSGIDYSNEVCSTCGGTGWGLLGNVEFCRGR